MQCVYNDDADADDRTTCSLRSVLQMKKEPLRVVVAVAVVVCSHFQQFNKHLLKMVLTKLSTSAKMVVNKQQATSYGVVGGQEEEEATSRSTVGEWW